MTNLTEMARKRICCFMLWYVAEQHWNRQKKCSTDIEDTGYRHKKQCLLRIMSSVCTSCRQICDCQQAVWFGSESIFHDASGQGRWLSVVKVRWSAPECPSATSNFLERRSGTCMYAEVSSGAVRERGEEQGCKYAADNEKKRPWWEDDDD